jgi:hypothetical protein
MNGFEGERPEPFASDEYGRGLTLEDAINDGIKKQTRGHGDVLHVELFVSVSNPHVGEYIVRLS